MKQNLLKPLFLFIISGFLSTRLNAQTQKYHRIQATISNKKFQTLMKAGLGIDHYEYKYGLLTAEVSDDDISLLKRKNVAIKYIIRDIA